MPPILLSFPSAKQSKFVFLERRFPPHDSVVLTVVAYTIALSEGLINTLLYYAINNMPLQGILRNVSQYE
jgi:hypothetical protein